MTQSAIAQKMFEKAEEIRKKNGFCYIDFEPYKAYASIPGKRWKSNALSGMPVDVDVKYIIELSDGKPVIKFLNGVTGYEGYYLSDIIAGLKRHSLKTLIPQYISICTGTPNRWDRLDVHYPSLVKVVMDYYHVWNQVK